MHLMEIFIKTNSEKESIRKSLRRYLNLGQGQGKKYLRKNERNYLRRMINLLEFQNVKFA